MSRRRFFGQKEVDIKLRLGEDGTSASADSVVGGCVAASAGKVGNSTPIVGQSQRRTDMAAGRAGPARLLPPFRGQSVVQAQRPYRRLGRSRPLPVTRRSAAGAGKGSGALMPSMTGYRYGRASCAIGRRTTSCSGASSSRRRTPQGWIFRNTCVAWSNRWSAISIRSFSGSQSIITTPTTPMSICLCEAFAMTDGLCRSTANT